MINNFERATVGVENGQFFDLAILRFNFNRIHALIQKFMNNHRDYDCADVGRYLQILQQAVRKYHAIIALNESTLHEDPGKPNSTSTPMKNAGPLYKSTARNRTELSAGGNKYYTAECFRTESSCKFSFLIIFPKISLNKFSSDQKLASKKPSRLDTKARLVIISY